MLAETFFTMMSRDTRAEVSRIAAPVVVLLTTENLPTGAVRDVEMQYRRQLAPVRQHELIVVEGSRHYVMYDAPETFFGILDHLLGRS